ncbi:hypothetical protein WG907_02975 [Sphingobium sp. AN558]|uniref:hypothetical protein n=1 Tax=Sphingobium sp. AN558 TaxID=3133442 RepID=UPI0030C010C9
MAIAVLFPDGSTRHVPAQLRACAPADDKGGPPAYEQVPLNYDARWRFARVTGRWVALPRKGSIVVLRPPAAPWWSDIALMRDGISTVERGDTMVVAISSAHRTIRESAA